MTARRPSGHNSHTHAVRDQEMHYRTPTGDQTGEEQRGHSATADPNGHSSRGAAAGFGAVARMYKDGRRAAPVGRLRVRRPFTAVAARAGQVSPGHSHHFSLSSASPHDFAVAAW
jgi:hypothetical protein